MHIAARQLVRHVCREVAFHALFYATLIHYAFLAPVLTTENSQLYTDFSSMIWIALVIGWYMLARAISKGCLSPLGGIRIKAEGIR